MSAKGKPRRAGKPEAHRFYHRALDEAERIDLETARRIEGLDDEIAILRLRLRHALEEHPEDLHLMARGMELLIKAVSAKYRLSPRSRGDLADSIAGVLESAGSLLLPEA